MLDATLQLDHIGIAVSHLPQMTQLFHLLGIQKGSTEAVPEQGVNTHFFPVAAEKCNLELLEPTGPSGAVAKFLEKKGPGIHHLSFRVQAGGLEPLCVKLRAQGYRLIYDHPKGGAHGMKINFIHPESAGGILIEIMEPGG